jgi:putative intracellular protease/amidase
LIPLPDHDFDPTESATPWLLCKQRGWRVSFSTEHGQVAAADPRLLLGPLRGPLGAGPKGLRAYQAMSRDQAFLQPIPYAEIDPSQFTALSLTGGHAPGMRQYLESSVLQRKAFEFWQAGKVIGAICHGVLVLARAIDPASGCSLLHGSRVTALTKNLERSGYALTFWLLGRRYRTYDCFVADEVRACLAHPGDFSDGPSMLLPYAVVDGRLVTARWPLDAMRYSQRLIETIEENLTG